MINVVSRLVAWWVIVTSAVTVALAVVLIALYGARGR